MNASRETLARYQARLAESLRTSEDPDEVRRALLADPELTELTGYIESLRTETLAIALALAAKWRSD